MNVLFITSNKKIYKIIKELVLNFSAKEISFDFFGTKDNLDLPVIDLINEADYIIKNFDVIFSLHCEEKIPECIINKRICINLHPGYNPYNRGWYPHVWSIINRLPAGATLHYIDREIDHGDIIDHIEVPIQPYDVSDTVYKKIIQAEKILFINNFKKLIINNFKVPCFKPVSEGNIKYKKDFECLKELKLSDSDKKLINHIRAMTFSGFKDLYYFDNGKKIHISIHLEEIYE